MSIGRRIFNLAKSELNSLLDKAAEWDERADDADDAKASEPDEAPHRRPGERVRLEDLTDAELAAEIERRQRERTGGAAPPPPSSGPTARQAPPRAKPREAPPPPRTPTAASAIAKAYAALEVPPGSSFEVVRKSYRTLMRKYHPDRHTASPEKQKAATELAQRLTESYKTLEKHLRK